MAEPPATFAVLLRRLRAEAGLTQEELAEAATLSVRSVSDLERGINLTARRETARLLADALGLSGPARTEFEAAARGRPVGSTFGPGGPLTTGGIYATRTLPRDIASFTGRESELRTLVDTAAPPAGLGGVVGIHAIGGMAGVGKTAFAVHVAHRLAPQFPDGQIFLSLHGHTPGRRPVDTAAALASLLQVTGVTAQQMPSGLEERMAMWRDRLTEKRLLLVLDDAVGSEQVQPLLPGTAGSLVLVTSRRHLTALEDATAISLDILPSAEAAALLVRLVDRPGLSCNDPPVSELARLCGYLPLALGMLARQLHHHPAWTPADLAADLTAARDRLDLMTTENLSVAAAFNLSYDELTVSQQQMFRHLGLHPGNDIDAYAAAALNSSDPAAARRHLAILYDHYLLTEPVRGRYRLHDLIREHARALALTDPPPQIAAASDRLLGYYQRAAEAAGRQMASQPGCGTDPGSPGAPAVVLPELPDPGQALTWARSERANMLACLDQVTHDGRDSWVIALTMALGSLLRHDGPWADGIARHQRAVQAARHLGDRVNEAHALTGLGTLQYLTGQYQSSVATLRTALDTYRDIADRPGEACALTNLGSALRRMAKYPAATEALHVAVDIYRGLGNSQGEAAALNDLGIVGYQTGNFSAASAMLESCLQICSDNGDRQGQASALSDLGATCWRMGQYGKAADNLTAAMAIYEDLGDRPGQVGALNDLGVVKLMTSDYANAIDALESAHAIAADIGDRLGQLNACNYLGDVRRRIGDLEGATEALESTVRIAIVLGDRQGEASGLFQLGAVRRLTGDLPGAFEAAGTALRVYRDLGNRHGQAESLSCLGVLRRVAGDYPGSARDLVSSLAMYREIGLRGGEAEVLNELGTLRHAERDVGQAEACYRDALRLARQITSPHEEAHALAGLGRCSLADGHVVEAEDGLLQAQEIYQRIGAAETDTISAEIELLRSTINSASADPPY